MPPRPRCATGCNDMNRNNPLVMPTRCTRARSHARAHVSPVHQRGVALVVSLMLLIVVALVGLAGVRNTIMQQKVSSNLYDREQAFQSAEAAMRVATALLPSSPGLIARNCQAGGVVCQGNPFTDPNLPANVIQTVATGTTSTTFTAGAVAKGQPQFVIENMGNYVDPQSAGFGD